MTHPKQRRKSQLIGVSALTPPEIEQVHSDWPELFDGLNSEQESAVRTGLSIRLRSGQKLDYDTVQKLATHTQTCPFVHA